MDPSSQPAGKRPAVEPHRPAHTQLFALRLWRAELGESQTEWRGQLQHVISGQIRYFRDWPTLIRQLSEQMAETDPNQAAGNGVEP